MRKTIYLFLFVSLSFVGVAQNNTYENLVFEGASIRGLASWE